MKKTTDDEGYGVCDEIDGPDECEGCKGCAVTAGERKDHAFTPADPESMKTQPVRIRVADLALLQILQQTDDETPGGVIHRVLEERGTARYEGGEFDSDEDTIKKYESVIEKQKEKITTQRREIDEQKNTITVLKSASADTGENVFEIQKEYEENLAKFQDQREGMLDTIRQMTANHQEDLHERGRMIEELEDELDERDAIDNEHICVGSGTTININIFKGNRTGAE